MYQFDEIEVYGDVEEINNNLCKLFGFRSFYHHKTDELLTFYFEGIYTASNYICDYDYAEPIFNLVDSLPFIDDFVECEFVDI